jgi:hypothetical protein
MVRRTRAMTGDHADVPYVCQPGHCPRKIKSPQSASSVLARVTANVRAIDERHYYFHELEASVRAQTIIAGMMTRQCEAPDCGNELPKDLPWNARYCSTRCKGHAARARAAAGSDFAVSPGRDKPDTAKNAVAPADHAFRRLQGDAVLSNWKLRATLETDIPDIPDFLRRTQEQRQAGWGHFDRWRATHPGLPISTYRRDADC